MRWFWERKREKKLTTVCHHHSTGVRSETEVYFPPDKMFYKMKQIVIKLNQKQIKPTNKEKRVKRQQLSLIEEAGPESCTFIVVKGFFIKIS